MVDFYILCVLFVFLGTVKGAPPIKGLYCQDPDTSKLYPIDSTWPSETFCGNYTCKLRKKNVVQTEYAPLTKTNVTALKKNEDIMSDAMVTSPSEHSLVVIKKLQPTKPPILHNDAINKINAITHELKNGGLDDNDRYLTESEIKTISEILHTVKKSDLEAIVEIYNIAQDIFKEIDTGKIDTLDKDKGSAGNNHEIEIKKKFINNNKKSLSYWYEPLHHSNPKENPKDLKIAGTSAIPTTRSYTDSPTYFKGPLSDRDFKKLPYYYPLSNFHRMSSYYRNKPPYYMHDHVPYGSRPCNKPFNNILPPWLNAPTKKNMPEPTKPQFIQPMLLPYPFSYVHHYNVSTYPVNFYYNNYPWSKLDVYNKNKNYPPHSFGGHYNSVPSTAVLSNAQEVKQKYGNHIKDHAIEGDTITNSEEVRPEWQTDELSEQILEEVKANIIDKSKLKKPLPSEKSIKLEKVGKVIKLDELVRSKRSTNSTDDKNSELDSVQYEPYIEKTICQSSTEPGFFRMGNLTQPYPDCCPQMISS